MLHLLHLHNGEGGQEGEALNRVREMRAD